MNRLDRNALLAALETAIGESWAAFRRAQPDDRVYGVGIYTSEVASYVGMTLFSEAGLDEVAAEYARSSGRVRDDEKAALRWSPADSPHHMWREEAFEAAQRVLDAAPDPHDDATDSTDRVRGAFDVFVEVLEGLDARGTFGGDRAQLVLSIWIGDQSDEDRVDFARRLNPPEVAQRFEDELEAANG